MILNEKLNKLFETGFFHIFGSTVINKIIGFLSSILIVRIISKTDFGVYSYANNILSIALIFSGMGMTSGVFQLCSENSKEKEYFNSIYKYGTKWGTISNVFLGIIIIIISLSVPLSIEGSNWLLLLMSGYPIITVLFQFQQTYLRASLNNISYSYVTMLNTILILIFSVIGSLVYSTIGLIVGTYLANIITVITSEKHFQFYNNGNVSISKRDKKDLKSISFISMFNNGLSQLLYSVDLFIIGVFIINPDIIATYKTATIIPTALYFIPSSVCMYIYPYFVIHKEDKEWTINKYKLLLKVMCVLNFIISVILFLFAPLIIKVFFGEQYLDAVNIFRILVIGYFFNGTFKGVAGNLLVSQRKLKFNLFTSVLALVINITFSIILLPMVGIIGAAISNTCVNLIIGMISTIYYIQLINAK